jgi:3-methyladenine DNA glycosylase AlkD
MPPADLDFVTADTLAHLVRRGVAGLGDPERAPGMQAYMKSRMPYRGVTSVPLSRFCRDTFDRLRLADEEQWRRAVLLLWDDAEFREERYAATSLVEHRAYREHLLQPHSLDLLRHLVVTGAWWDHVDRVSHLVGRILLAHRATVTPRLQAWAVDDDLWVRRTAIICQVGLKADVDQDLLRFAITANLDGSTRSTPAGSTYGREFFVRKAIGWALRDHARVDPGWVGALVEELGPRLSGLSRREALKHL